MKTLEMGGRGWWARWLAWLDWLVGARAQRVLRRPAERRRRMRVFLELP